MTDILGDLVQFLSFSSYFARTSLVGGVFPSERERAPLPSCFISFQAMN